MVLTAVLAVNAGSKPEWSSCVSSLSRCTHAMHAFGVRLSTERVSVVRRVACDVSGQRTSAEPHRKIQLRRAESGARTYQAAGAVELDNRFCRRTGTHATRLAAHLCVHSCPVYAPETNWHQNKRRGAGAVHKNGSNAAKRTFGLTNQKNSSIRYIYFILMNQVLCL